MTAWVVSASAWASAAGELQVLPAVSEHRGGRDRGLGLGGGTCGFDGEVGEQTGDL